MGETCQCFQVGKFMLVDEGVSMLVVEGAQYPFSTILPAIVKIDIRVAEISEGKPAIALGSDCVNCLLDPRLINVQTVRIPS